MSETEEMTINERRKYLYKMWERYRKGTLKEKGDLLNEMEEVTGMHRKSLIRILRGRLSRKKREKERGPYYGTQVEDAIRVIARSLDYPCAERLKPRLGWMARHLGNHNSLHLGPETLEKLEQISISTLKRMMKKAGKPKEKIAYRKPQHTRRNHLRQTYPMRRIPWDTPEPGHFEVDLVVHCGEKTEGDCLHTLHLIDVATGWSEIEAVYGRSFKAMRNGFEFIMKRLPFPILELHPDNGAEFFNHHLLRFWNSRIVTLELSRSRPFHKNDNRFVEENNHSLVRAYVGHGRMDTLQHLDLLRKLYQLLWVYHNFFQPVLRTHEKLFSDQFHYRRIFDTARPPLDRLCEWNAFPEPARSTLLRQRDLTNVVDLRTNIEILISCLSEPVPYQKQLPFDVSDSLRKEPVLPVTFSIEPSILVQ